jgi:hypothetical protein
LASAIQEKNMNILKEVVGVIGCIVLVYYGARITATVIDFCQHRYRILAANVPEERIIAQLEFWSDLENFVKACRDSGEFPLEDALTIDVSKGSMKTLTDYPESRIPSRLYNDRLMFLLPATI